MKAHQLIIASLGLTLVNLEAHAAWSARDCEVKCTAPICLMLKEAPGECSRNCSHERLPPECIPVEPPAQPAVQHHQGGLPILSREEQENLRNKKIVCAKTMTLKQIVDIKSRGYIEYEGHVYQPDNMADFQKSAPANYQFLTKLIKNATLIREYADPENPPPSTICEYTYKTLENQRYTLVLRVGSAFLQK